MDYGFKHDGKVYTPNATPGIAPDACQARNREIEAQELAAWAEQPDRFVGYYNEKRGTVTTWLGTAIGRIMHYNVYQHGFGGKFISLTMQGTNGARYYGRASHDWQIIRLHKAKVR